jgi:hypothetical protein
MGSEQVSRFLVREIEFFERPVKLRMPFRFGVVTLTEAPQAFARVRILLGGKESEGAAAEMLVPKWFDKNPALSNEDNFEQLRASMRNARNSYLTSGLNTAAGHSRPTVGLVENFGPALLDRALLDALCRALGISFYEAIRKNVAGLELSPRFLASRKPTDRIAARHTVGLLDPITSLDNKSPVKDGLPETLEEVIARYGHRWFKLKVGGDARADVERLAAIAAVLDRDSAPYHASLDGNEQYESAAEVLGLLRKIQSEERLKRLAASIVFIEQPIKRQNALKDEMRADLRALAKFKPVIIDESDDSLDAFPRAKALGYRGVSSKTCKGIYKSLTNAARCAEWGEGYFMTGEDLTIQAGLALQQDLALASLLGLTHVERNGHHYVNGMAGLPAEEQERFYNAHPDLYERSHGAVRVRIEKGMIEMKSLDCPGYASRTLPDWGSMRTMP